MAENVDKFRFISTQLLLPGIVEGLSGTKWTSSTLTVNQSRRTEGRMIQTHLMLHLGVFFCHFCIDRGALIPLALVKNK